VIVMLMIIVMLVIGLIIPETDLTGEARLGQELERTINGSVSDGRVLFLHEPIEVLARKMLLGTQEYFENEVPLPGAPQAGFLYMFEENFLFFLEFFLFLRHIVMVNPIDSILSPEAAFRH
jgi:hypothetical protein